MYGTHPPEDRALQRLLQVQVKRVLLNISSYDTKTTRHVSRGRIKLCALCHRAHQQLVSGLGHELGSSNSMLMSMRCFHPDQHLGLPLGSLQRQSKYCGGVAKEVP